MLDCLHVFVKIKGRVEGLAPDIEELHKKVL
jgi:hypothetical protein